MESSPKRRKVSHNGDTRTASNSGAVATASPFILQTEELLKELEVDYSRALDGADALLKQAKDIIDSLPDQQSIPVGSMLPGVYLCC